MIDQLFKQISPEEIGDKFNIFTLIDLLTTTAGDHDHYNSMVGSGGGLGLLFKKATVWCSIRSDRYTIELIEKKKVQFSCQFNEWAIFQYELNQQQIDYQEDYSAEGVQVSALFQLHQIQPFALKIQDVTRGREQLKIIEEATDG